MRRTLGTLALLLTLVGCGDDDASDADVDHPAEPETVVLVHATAGGGDAATQTTDVTSDDDLAGYVEQFDDSLAAKVTEAAAGIDLGSDQALVAQVVSVGCDVPPGASVQENVIVPEKVPSPMQECLAPVTTVGLAAVPA